MLIKLAADARHFRALTDKNSGVRKVLEEALEIAKDIPAAVKQGEIVQETAHLVRHGAKARRNSKVNAEDLVRPLTTKAHAARLENEKLKGEVRRLGVAINDQGRAHRKQLGEASRRGSELLASAQHKGEMNRKAYTLAKNKAESLEMQRNAAALANVVSALGGGAVGHRMGANAARKRMMETWVPAVGGGALLAGVGGGFAAGRGSRD